MQAFTPAAHPDFVKHAAEKTFSLEVQFHHNIFATHLLTNFLAKLPHKQMSHTFLMFFNQKFVENQICLQQTQICEFVSEFVTKLVAKM
jgi:hypothetical protein